MKQNKRKRLLSLLVTLAMVIGLMQGMCLTAYAATLDSSSTIWSEDSTITDDVTINNKVTVNASITLTIPAGKTLTVNGDGNALCEILPNTIEGSIGSGCDGNGNGNQGGTGGTAIPTTKTDPTDRKPPQAPVLWEMAERSSSVTLLSQLPVARAVREAREATEKIRTVAPAPKVRAAPVAPALMAPSSSMVVQLQLPVAGVEAKEMAMVEVKDHLARLSTVRSLARYWKVMTGPLDPQVLALLQQNAMFKSRLITPTASPMRPAARP